MTTPWISASTPAARRWWDGPGAASGTTPVLQYTVGGTVAGQALFVGWWRASDQTVQPLDLLGWWDKPPRLIRSVKEA